jgi:hypothetical protein
MANPLFRNQGPKLADGETDPAQLSAQNGGIEKQKKKYPIPAQPAFEMYLFVFLVFLMKLYQSILVQSFIHYTRYRYGT